MIKNNKLTVYLGIQSLLAIVVILKISIIFNLHDKAISVIIIMILALSIFGFVISIRNNVYRNKERCSLVNSLTVGYLDSIKEYARKERHDFMNIFQVIYGYLQLNKSDKAIEEIKKITETTSSLSKAFKLTIPSLSFVMARKIQEAHNLGISIRLSITKDVDYELRGILNEGEIAQSFDDVFSIIIEYLSSIEYTNTAKIYIDEYEDRLEIILCRGLFKELEEVIKELHTDIFLNDDEIILVFKYLDVEVFEVKENYLSKIIFN